MTKLASVLFLVGISISPGAAKISPGPAKIQVGYWSIRGPGACIRMVLDYAGMDYVNVFYETHKQADGSYHTGGWLDARPGFKAKYPSIKNLPYIIDGDIVVTQTNEILRYVGKKVGLYAKTAQQDAKINQVLKEVQDLRNTCAGFFSHKGNDPEFSTRASDAIKASYGEFEARLAKEGTLYTAGPTPTVGDFRLFETLDQNKESAKVAGVSGPWSELEDFPKLKALHNALKADTKMQAYSSSWPYPLPPNSEWATPVAGGNPSGISISPGAANISPGPAKTQVGYWNIRGLGQCINMALAYAGMDYENVLYETHQQADGSFDTRGWLDARPDLKAKYPSIELPYIIDGDIVVTQTNAILRYVGKKAGLYGNTDQQNAKINQVLEKVQDLRNKCAGFLPHKGNVQESRIQAWNAIKASYGEFEARLAKEGTLYTAGPTLTVGDVRLFETLEQNKDSAKEAGVNDTLKDFPKLRAFYKALESDPKIQAYFASLPYKLPPNSEGATPVAGGSRLV